MPRQARLRVAGWPMHVVQRGNNRSTCFCGTSDYLVYLHLLAEYAPKFECALHAYVLMTNHVHLLLTPADASGASLLLKHVGQRYTQYANKAYGRTGTLWEGRFKSSVVDAQSYLLSCYRYIELNPVRAAMVVHPRDYRWSSYRANAEGASSALITPHAEFLALAADENRRSRIYARLFDTALDEDRLREIRDAARGGYVLGRREFKDSIAATLHRRVEKAAAGRPRKIRDRPRFS